MYTETKRQDDRHEDRRGDAEVEVRREVDRAVRVDERACVVRDLGQHAVERRDQEVDSEARCDAGERSRHPGERVAPDALERGGAQGYQHEIPGIRGNAREDPDEDDDRRQQRLRRDGDELADERADQPRGLGETDADHHHEDDRHRGEVAEVRDERGEEEADRRRRTGGSESTRSPRGRCSRPPGPMHLAARPRVAWSRR